MTSKSKHSSYIGLSVVDLECSKRSVCVITSPCACWTRKVGMGLGMSGKILYVYASVCIKERIACTEWRFVSRSCSVASHLSANFVPIAEATLVLDESHVDESRPGRDVREIGDPELIRPNGGELALDQICRITRLVTADRGSALTPTHNPLQPERSHQSFDATAGDCDALSAELSPDLARAVNLEVLIPDALDLLRDLDISPTPRRQPLRIRLSRLVLVVSR